MSLSWRRKEPSLAVKMVLTRHMQSCSNSATDLLNQSHQSSRLKPFECQSQGYVVPSNTDNGSEARFRPTSPFKFQSEPTSCHRAMLFKGNIHLQANQPIKRFILPWRPRPSFLGWRFVNSKKKMFPDPFRRPNPPQCHGRYSDRGAARP